MNMAGLERLLQAPAMLRQAMQLAAMGIAQRAASDLRASDDVPKWTGNLADGLRAIPLNDGRIGAQVLVEAEYTQWVHEGRTPGTFPNVDNLADWARDHGMKGAEWAIATNIKNNGIKAKPFLKTYANSLAFQAMAQRVLTAEVNHALA